MKNLSKRLRGTVDEVRCVVTAREPNLLKLAELVGQLEEIAIELLELSELPMGKAADKIVALENALTTSYADAAHSKAKADKYDAAIAAGTIEDDLDVAAIDRPIPQPPTDAPPADTTPGTGGTDTTVAGTGTDTVTPAV